MPVAKFLLISVVPGLDMRNLLHQLDRKKGTKRCSDDLLYLNYLGHLFFGKALLFTGYAEQNQEFGSDT